VAEGPKRTSESETFRSIDYEATYAKMRQRSTARQQVAYKQYVINYLRVAVYYIAMISLQYAHAGMVLVAVFELAKMSVCTVLLVRKKYYRHWLMFVYDNQNSALMAVYFAIQLVKPNDEASIRLLTVACLLEYVGLLVCIGYFLKASRAAKKAALPQSKPRIDYRENYDFIAMSRQPSQGSLLHDLDSSAADSFNASVVPEADIARSVFKNRLIIVPGIDSRVNRGFGKHARIGSTGVSSQQRNMVVSGSSSTFNQRSLDNLDERQ
jgi:hypothetical protein